MKPDPHIALIYHYDLARALNGEPVDWQAIPVNVDAGREGGDLCRAAADFGKRRDLFAMPAPTPVHDGPPVCTVPGCRHNALTDPTCGWHPRKIAVPIVPAVVEQPAADPEPDTASTPVPGANRERDLCTYGQCWCGEPRHSEVIDDPNYQGGKLSRLVCYAGHTPEDDTCHRCGGIGCVACDARFPPFSRDLLRARIKALVDGGHESVIRGYWPQGIAPLSKPGHTDDDLQEILCAVKCAEAEVGAGWHPDDDPEPHSRIAIQRALAAWHGRDPDKLLWEACWIATVEQVADADITLEALVAQFTIEQADRLHDAAHAASNQ